MLLAAGAGAGLATAFNAPIAGAVFVLEEFVRRFDTRITIVTSARRPAHRGGPSPLGDSPDFHVEPMPYPSVGTVPLHLALGVVAGGLGVVYNRAILATLAISNRFHRWPVELRAALVGAAVALLAWFAPDVVGGGDVITQRTLSGTETAAMFRVFFLRFGLGLLSYAAGTPGGLFAPILVFGSQSGVLFGISALDGFPM